jgi:predicted DsbA family dithiol-disulfide isomerase
LEREGLVRVTYLPFELHPEAPPEGIPYETYFGGARSLQVHSYLQTVAEQVGLKMQSRGVIINSRRALGAAEYAREQGKFDEMHHALFKAHWEQTGRLEDVDDLVRIGTEVGLDPTELRAAIEEGKYEDVIDENRQTATSAGINAIPAHVFGRRYLVMGAQPYDVLKQVVDRVTSEA